MWKELMYNSVVGTAAVETALTSFTPTKSGRLIGVQIVVGGAAATSLMEAGYVKMACPTFGGVDCYFPFVGNGLRTVPATPIPIFQHAVDLQVVAGTPIKGYIYWNVTATTPAVMVYGIFQ